MQKSKIYCLIQRRRQRPAEKYYGLTTGQTNLKSSLSHIWDRFLYVSNLQNKWYDHVMYGHVSRSSGLAKPILQGIVKGERRQGRQTKRWEDNIRERTGLEFAKPQRAMDNIEKWTKLVVKSSVMPQRPLRLRDR